MKAIIIIFTSSLLVYGCNAPYLYDNGEVASENSIVMTASFYININPYCCERRGLDSADVVDAAIKKHGESILFTLVSLPNRTDTSKIKYFGLRLLDNTKDLGGEHKFDNCDKLVSHTEELTIGDWELQYYVRNELGQWITEYKTFTVQGDVPSQNCFRIF